jgi:hypothetical protein
MISKTNGGFLKQLNEEREKKNQESADKEQELLIQERNPLELINTQTGRQNETRFRIVSFVKEVNQRKKNYSNNERLAEKE